MFADLFQKLINYAQTWSNNQVGHLVNKLGLTINAALLGQGLSAEDAARIVDPLVAALATLAFAVLQFLAFLANHYFVKSYQEKNNLKPDAWAGPQTNYTLRHNGH